jgi:hypothetical protein
MISKYDLFRLSPSPQPWTPLVSQIPNLVGEESINRTRYPFWTTMQFGNMPTFRSRKAKGGSSKVTTKQRSRERCLLVSIQRSAWFVLSMVVIAVVFFDVSDFGFPKKHRPSLHLVGERHSGTTWIHQHLFDCFAPEVSVRSGLSRWKHWFQFDGDYSSYQSVGGKAERKTVVVAQFRHAYHWVEAMRVKPHHAPAHFDLTWQEFVKRPWTMPAGEGKLGNVTLTGTETETHMCQHNFHPHEVVPCRMMEMGVVESGGIDVPVFAVYEMRSDGSGMPYDSILDLRADKIKNFLSIADFDGIQDLFPVQYEQLVRNGTATLIHNLEEALGVQAHCSPTNPETFPSRALPPEYVKWMKEHVDWETEALIGYDDSTF